MYPSPVSMEKTSLIGKSIPTPRFKAGLNLLFDPYSKGSSNLSFEILTPAYGRKLIWPNITFDISTIVIIKNIFVFTDLK